MTTTADLAPTIQGFDPRTGAPAGSPVPATADVGAVVEAAAAAGRTWARVDPRDRAQVLRAIASALEADGEELRRLADLETALGQPRLTGELTRTTNQLRHFAEVLEEGSFVEAVISPGDSGLESGTPRPDVRRMLQPIGPVAVFSASNFPFAFSVAGGDTASALAAGCAVVVKAHEAHPVTSQRTADVVRAALAEAGQPADLLGLVQGRSAGVDLVQHPAITAVGFTGSLRGGRALMDLAAARPMPIPFYGELGSVNPVVVLPGASGERAQEIAAGYVGSLTLGTGQYCTNPGLLFVPTAESDSAAGAAPTELVTAIAAAVSGAESGVMLTRGMQQAFAERRTALSSADGLRALPGAAAEPGDGFAVSPVVFETDLATFRQHHEDWAQECFGPTGFVVGYADRAELLAFLATLPGSLTGTVHAADSDADAAAEVRDVLARGVGRVIYNGWPTGVAVCWAMHHGGPWPATNSVHTSVGATSIRRWLAPVAYQDWPDAQLPPALQRDNPWQIVRRVDAILTR